MLVHKIIKICQNGSYYCINDHLIDCINISNNYQIKSKRFELSFNFQIIIEFEEQTITNHYNQKGIIWFETYDYYIYYNWLKEKIKSESYNILNTQMLVDKDQSETIYYVCPNNGLSVYSNINNINNMLLDKYKSHIKYDYEFESSSKDRNEYDINLNIKTTKCIITSQH